MSRAHVLLACLAGAALIAAAPLVLPEFTITLLNYIGLYALVGVGLVLLTGVGGLTSFGQAAFVGMGAYTTALLTTAADLPSWLAWLGASPWSALAAGLGLTLAAAYGLGALTLRLSGHYLPLGTIAWGISIYFLFGNAQWLGGFTGITGIAPLSVAGRPLASGRELFALIWLVLAAALLAARNLLDSREGRAIRALKGGRVMAESMGIDTGASRRVIFVIAALLACVSGWLYAHMQRFVNPTPFSLQMGIEYLFMAVIGGAGHVWGALLGAIVITLAKQWLQDWLPALVGQAGNFEVIVFGALMVVILQRAPDGLWPALARLADRLPRKKKIEVPELDALRLSRRAMPPRGKLLLEVDAVTRRFGGLIAVDKLTFRVNTGEIVALIGPNGAGKSTCFDLISGVAPPDEGTVRWRGRAVSGEKARAIAALGLARTFQHVKLLPQMSLLDNAALGAHLREKPGLWRGVFTAAWRLDRKDEARLRAEAARQLHRVGLAEHAFAAAGSLPLGQQRTLEVARALCADPYLLLLDEPAAGLRLLEKRALADLLRRLRDQGLAVLLVEHDMDFVMGLADRVVVMDFGQKIAEGKPQDVQRDPRVVEAYLGAVQ